LGAYLRTQPTEKEVIRMRKKQPKNPPRQNEHILHQIGRERFVNIQKYAGDIPTGEPVDWFEQVDEYDMDEITNKQTD
jgi:hypothetical protein